jgi:hypothetical protein
MMPYRIPLGHCPSDWLLPRYIGAALIRLFLKQVLVSGPGTYGSGGTRDAGHDCWSLVSLRNDDGGPGIELKFVQRMRRQCEFSMDSIQVYEGALCRRMMHDLLLQCVAEAAVCEAEDLAGSSAYMF